MKLSEKQAKFLLDFALLIRYATNLGFTVTPGELHRTMDQQKIYVNTGRSRTMHSLHLEGLAGDLNFLMDGIYINGLEEKAVDILKPIGQFWESLGGTWGGNFDKDWRRRDPWVDVGHFQWGR